MIQRKAKERVMARKFREGEYYPFVVGQRVPMDEGEDYLSLTDQWGKKHLLPFQRFRKYKFEKGQTIFLKVDKINCQGKVFFEPPHPCHSEGEIKEFTVNRARQHSNSFGETEILAAVEDCLGYESEVPFDGLNHSDLPEKLSCRVEKIENGKVYLIPSYLEYQGSAVDGDELDLLIQRLVTLSEREFFLLGNEENQNFRLRLKFCQGLGFKPGMIIRCRVRRLRNGFLTVDPFHPLYSEGRSYPFQILDETEIPDSEGYLVPAFELRDSIGNRHLVSIPLDFPLPESNWNTAICKIEGFSKGKLVLNLEQVAE